MKFKKFIDDIYFSRKDDTLSLTVKGWAMDLTDDETLQFEVTTDRQGSQHLPVQHKIRTREDVLSKVDYDNEKCGFKLTISLEDEIVSDLYVFAVSANGKQLLRHFTKAKLELLYKRQSRIQGAVDKVIEYPNFVYVSGWAMQGTYPQPVAISVTQNNKTLKLREFRRFEKENKVLKRNVGAYGFEFVIEREQFDFSKSFHVILTGKEHMKQELVARVNANDSRGPNRFNIDSLQYVADDKTALLYMTGWFVVGKSDNITMTLETKNGEPIDATPVLSVRPDLAKHDLMTRYDDSSGFELRVDVPINEPLNIIITSDNQMHVYPLSVEQMKQFNQKTPLQKIVRAVKNINPINVKRTIEFYKVYGLKTTVTKIKSALLNGVNVRDYAAWYAAQQPDEQELKVQRDTKFEYTPKISVVVPTYRTPENYLREMIECVINQTYANWELCIAEGSNDDGKVLEIIKEYAQKDDRVKYTVLSENLGISGNTNACLDIATGDFIALFDHDDLLPPQSLFEIVKVLQDASVDVVYTDEDKIDETSQIHSGPNFKPKFSLELLRSLNYITHFFVVKRDIVKQVGGFRSEFDGAQDFDFILRCCEVAKNIRHIGQILYHWRIHSNSTAGNPESKLYAYTAGARAIQSHLDRMGIKGTVEMLGFTGYQTTLEPVGNPLVSILIPNKDNTDVLDTCVQSIFKQKAYTNYEIIVIENNSTQPETFAYYEKLQSEHDNVKVVVWDGIFNYSAINNFGATFAKGEYLLLLNNDTEMLSETALKDMLGVAVQEGVGAVGAKLLYPDRTIQHAGVILGIDNVPTHILVNMPDEDKSYRHNSLTNYLAVTAACLMTPRKVFDEVGGLSEDFVVAFNDIDYCLKVYEKGYRIVNNGFAKWLHYESKSRGYENTPEKVKRFLGEKERFKNKWDDKFPNGDPYYNHELPQ